MLLLLAVEKSIYDILLITMAVPFFAAAVGVTSQVKSVSRLDMDQRLATRFGHRRLFFVRYELLMPNREDDSNNGNQAEKSTVE